MIIFAALLCAGICVNGLNKNFDKRIINGWKVEAGEYRWIAMMKRVIHLSKYSHSESAWGATIIAERWLLTAAHSFWDNRKKMQRKDLTVYHVYVGNPLAERGREYKPRENVIEGNYNGSNGHENEVFHLHVEKVILHPKFIATQKTNADYDIALVKLTGSIPINDSRITVAKLPDIKKGSNWPPPNVQCAISGWGCTYNRGPGQKTARAVWMRTMKKQECVDAYHIKFEWKPEMRFCAGHYKGGGATCIGDSGSGLVCEHDSHHYIAGVLSTAGEEPENLPSFFVRVSYFQDWIKNVIETN